MLCGKWEGEYLIAGIGIHIYVLSHVFAIFDIHFLMNKRKILQHIIKDAREQMKREMLLKNTRECKERRMILANSA